MATEGKPLRGASGIAKLMALMCFEDSRLGRLQEGLGPVTWARSQGRASTRMS